VCLENHHASDREASREVPVVTERLVLVNPTVSSTVALTTRYPYPQHGRSTSLSLARRSVDRCSLPLLHSEPPPPTIDVADYTHITRRFTQHNNGCKTENRNTATGLKEGFTTFTDFTCSLRRGRQSVGYVMKVGRTH